MLAKKLQSAVAGQSAGGYTIARSLRFNSADSAYLSRTPGSTGSGSWTLSVWVKRSALGADYAIAGAQQSGVATQIYFMSNNTLRWYEGGADIQTTALFRDVSAWYHFVFVKNGSTSCTIYQNGVQIAQTTSSVPSTSKMTTSGASCRVGAAIDLGGSVFSYGNGYLADIYFADGEVLTPADFGEYNADTGVWQPIAYAGTYGTNGFHLDFSDNSSTSALGTDTSGNGNNWTANNFSVTAGAGNDSLVDTPTPYGTDTGVGGEVGGNYCTLNPIGRSYGTNSPLNGNLDVTGDISYTRLMGTIKPKSGKWYWEYTVLHSNDGSGGNFLGITTTDSSSGTSGNRTYQVSEAYAFFTGYTGLSQGFWYNGSQSTGFGTSATSGEIIQFAVDLDNNKIWVGKNGTWFNSGNPATGANTLATLASGYGWVPFDEGYRTGTWNFGQRPFAYTAPSGFKALCTTNLPEPDVVQGDTAFNTVLYTGNGSTQAITGVGFQPDFIWYKSRSSATWNHGLFDVLRGTSKQLFSNNTDAEGTYSGVTSFDADGFTVGSDNGGNESGGSMVAWNWKAGGSGVSNTDGSITSTVSANPTAGISVVTYTGNATSGATVGHGIGIAPNFIITKSRSNARNWSCYHSALGGTYYIFLNSTAAAATASTVWNNTDPSSSVFTLGNGGANASGEDYVAYCFAPVEGFSAFGKYTGNGSTDGPFIYTGFRPAFVMIKQSSTSGNNWRIVDTTRKTYNIQGQEELYPNTTDTENAVGAANYLDIVSNGFKLRNSLSGSNSSGSTYIYMAFAENPFKYSLGR